MRILRGRSSLEVSSQGFAWFVVGLVLATFLGGAVRTILSSERVHKRILLELRNRFPKHRFSIGETKVLLSRGLWPGLGLSLENVKFQQDVCGKLSFELAIPQIILPVDLLSLREGKIHLGKIEILGGAINLDYRSCADVEETGATENVLVPPTASPPRIPVDAVDWKKLSPFADGALVQNLTITYEPQKTWKLVIQDMDMTFRDELAAHGLWKVQKSLPFGEASYLVELDLQGDGGHGRAIHWAAQSEFKEGHVTFAGHLELASQVAVIQVTTRQLPVKDVVSELSRLGILETEIQLRPAWFTCALKWEGELKRIYQMPVSATDCRFEGAYGRIEVERANVWLDGSGYLKTPVRVRIDRLQIQAVMEVFKRKLLPAILAKIGVWSGELKFQSQSDWLLDGFLDRAEVVFSHRSVRGKQVIEKLHTKFKKEGNAVRAEIDEMIIQGGEFDGLIQARLHDDWRSGSFETDVRKLSLHPSIQSILVGGALGMLSAKGKGVLQAGEISHWNGSLDLERVVGPGWSGEKVILSSRYQPGVFSLDGRAAVIEARETWAGYSQLQKIIPQARGKFTWRDIRAKVDIQRGGGTVHRAAGHDVDHQRLWSFTGAWVRDGELNGLLTVGSRATKEVFTVHGERGVLNVINK